MTGRAFHPIFTVGTMPTVKGAHKVNSRYFPNRAILARSPNFLLNLNWQAVVQRSG
ncbi:MAG TPA: hypothetical protein VKY54_08510 [Kiloniellales bacterium]|nr:hypothetical protein [Kiloniellales bacterium]